LAKEFVDHRVDYLLFNCDVTVFREFKCSTSSFTEEPIGLGEDIGFVGYSYERTSVDASGATIPDLLTTDSNVAGHSCDPCGGALGDAFYSLGNTTARSRVGVGTFFFNIEILGVLADNDEVKR
jgi:hypothetical protein